MRAAPANNAKNTVLGGVTIENVQEKMRAVGIRPGQRVTLKVVDAGEELLRVMDRVSGRAEELGLTEEELKRMIEEE